MTGAVGREEADGNLSAAEALKHGEYQSKSQQSILFTKQEVHLQLHSIQEYITTNILFLNLDISKESET